MSTTSRASDERTLYVVMNGRLVGDIVQTGKNRARLRYEDPSADGFTPLSVSMPGPTGRYRETVLVPWVEALLPDRPETLRQWRRRFGITDQRPLALMPYVGEDVAGAAQFVRPSRLDVVLDRSGEARTLTDDDVAEMLARKADLRSNNSATPGLSWCGATTGRSRPPGCGAASTRKTCARRSASDPHASTSPRAGPALVE